ncbi:TetR/AcrR family transcriptional regulator [Desertibaculum subflavum]|uniref:TetR/AcrR family transcriptional regulator n=1 Tax=Desertibaculum subflavum TaxID=2268458 RepID=UPI000E664ECB
MKSRLALPADEAERVRFKRVVRAADELFRTYGFRGVTMERVAREAAVAKATLYSYFKNKDELFVAVSNRMAALLAKAFTGALEAGGKLDDRVAAAIVTRRRLAFELYRLSPHAEELHSAKSKLAGEIFAEAEREMEARLVQALRDDTALKPGAERLTRALYHGSAEIASRCSGVAELETELRAFVATHLAGARALARRH